MIQSSQLSLLGSLAASPPSTSAARSQLVTPQLTSTNSRNVRTTDPESIDITRRTSLSRRSRQRLFPIGRKRGNFWSWSSTQGSSHPVYRYRCSSLETECCFSWISRRPICFYICRRGRDTANANHKSG